MISKKNNVAIQKVNKRIITFLICFLISLFFWLLIALSQNYTHVINIGISYNNLSQETVENKLPLTLSAKINAKGFNLLAHYLRLQPRVIMLDIKSDSQKKGIIPSSIILEEIDRQLGSEIKVLKVEPEIIYLNFNKSAQKKVPVKLNLFVNFEKQHGLSDSIKIFPDSVLVSGPKAYIDAVKYIETDTVQFGKVNSKIVKSINLINKNKKVLLSPEKVQLIIQAEKFTEKKIEVPLEIINNSSKLSVVIIPEKVSISFMVGLSNYSRIDAGLFKAVVDLSSVDEHSDNKIKVKLEEIPPFINSVKVDPQKVQYIFLK